MIRSLDRTEFKAELPPRFDERTRLFAFPDGAVCVAHPEHPPLVMETDGSMHAVVMELGAAGAVSVPSIFN